jgi:hypothetical protein
LVSGFHAANFYLREICSASSSSRRSVIHAWMVLSTLRTFFGRCTAFRFVGWDFTPTSSRLITLILFIKVMTSAWSPGRVCF